MTSQCESAKGQIPRGSSLKKILRTKKDSKNSLNFLEDLKSVYIIWEWTTPRIQCLNPFLFIKSSYTQRNSKKSEKSEKV